MLTKFMSGVGLMEGGFAGRKNLRQQNRNYMSSGALISLQEPFRPCLEALQVHAVLFTPITVTLSLEHAA